VVAIRLSDALAALHPLLHMILPAPGALVVELAERDPPVLIERSALEETLLALAQQIAETQPRGLALTLAVAEGAGAGELAVRLPAGLAPPALALLAALAEAGGGTAEGGEGSLRLRLPPAAAGGG
jgi:hypothetical protein